MRRFLFNLIAAYVYRTPPHPGRGILARLAYRLYPNDFVAEIAPNVRIKVRLCCNADILHWTNRHARQGEFSIFLPLIQQGMTVMDIGANIGVYALHFARKVGPSGKVYAFEPVPEFFKRLKEHIALNQVTNIIPVPIALSNQKGTVKMSVAEESSSFFRHLTDQFIEVPTMPLDEFVAEQRIERVDAIKLDVEGAELLVIKGADQTIRKFKPIMMVEINELTLKAAGTTPEELFQTVVGYGYKAYVIRNGKAIITSEVVRPMGYHFRGVRFGRWVQTDLDNYLFLP